MITKCRYGYAEYHWNPITGCRLDCQFCIARVNAASQAGDIRHNKSSGQYERVADGECYVLEDVFTTPRGVKINTPFGFAPTLHKYRFGPGSVPAVMPNTRIILVGDMGEMFGDWVPEEWIDLVFRECEKYPQHYFLFLTRNPKRYKELAAKGKLPANERFWYGTSASWPSEIKEQPIEGFNNFICVTPIMESFADVSFKGYDWITVGARVGRKGKIFKTNTKWVSELRNNAALKGIPLYMMDTVVDSQERPVKEFPASMLQKDMGKKSKEKLRGICSGCKADKFKAEMVTISSRIRRGTTSKMTAFLCPDCFVKTCNEWGVEVPHEEVYKLGRSKTPDGGPTGEDKR